MIVLRSSHPLHTADPWNETVEGQPALQLCQACLMWVVRQARLGRQKSGTCAARRVCAALEPFRRGGCGVWAAAPWRWPCRRRPTPALRPARLRCMLPQRLAMPAWSRCPPSSPTACLLPEMCWPVCSQAEMEMSSNPTLECLCIPPIGTLAAWHFLAVARDICAALAPRLRESLSTLFDGISSHSGSAGDGRCSQRTGQERRDTPIDHRRGEGPQPCSCSAACSWR